MVIQYGRKLFTNNSFRAIVMDVTYKESKLKSPDVFEFPFQPYPIQEDFMRNLYTALEDEKLGIFESPTGTGKSMSIVCGALKWLFDSETKRKNDIQTELKEIEVDLNSETDGNDWLNEHHKKTKARTKKFELERLQRISQTREDKIKEAIDKAMNKRVYDEKNGRKKFKTKVNEELLLEESPKNQSDDEDILIDDPKITYTSDSDEEACKENDEKLIIPKIFLCSRTHSQLTQLAGEIQKSPYGDLGVRVVPLASRRNLCVNEAVLSLKNLSLINEACQDLRARKPCRTTKTSKKGEKLKKLKTSSGCPYTGEEKMEHLRGECLAKVHDIEELVEAGRDLLACPYFTARNCIADAHIVLVPYNTLLHKNTREASGIDLRGSIVIVDEAHNLLDTLGNINSAVISGLQISHTHSILIQYRDKYLERFSSMNLLHLNQLIFVVQKLLCRVTFKEKESVTISRLSDFLIDTEIDNMNMFNLLQFSSRSRLPNKLRGFTEKFQPSVVLPEKKPVISGVSAFLKNMKSKIPAETLAPADEPQRLGNSIPQVLAFLETLTNHCDDGRVVTTVGKTPNESFLKFLLLNPAAHFQDVITQARSVILAGGTMQPFSEFTDQLFRLAGAPSSRISTFSCDHVVPDSNILPIAVERGPGGRVFDFTFANRNCPELLDELGRLLVNTCNVIPAGVVVFFVSYEYEDRVFRYFSQKGIIAKLEAKKKVLREPRQSSQVESMLSQYGKAASTGALLFSVIGGKLSEGLNFNDDLGRCVMLVGMPYPNKTSPELKEKMAYLEQKIGTGAGSVYYENLCMKAVNQSIGRAVRHINDYASVLLLDHRYARPNIQSALPQWIRKSLQSASTFGSVQGNLAKFFASKRLSNKSIMY